MNLSMYTAASGAKAQQGRLDVISNNMANLQTDGYKSQRAGFADLLYENYRRGVNDDPETGSGVRLEKTDFSFEQGTIMETGGAYDYAISGDGFFAVYDPTQEMVYYTRDGNFQLSNYGNDVFYLVNGDGNLVLDKDMGMIPVVGGVGSDELPNIGVFDFENKEGFIAAGKNRYLPSPQSGLPFLKGNAVLMKGKVEASNVDLGDEFTRLIESQRAYQMTLKMIQTTDEVEQTINSLR